MGQNWSGILDSTRAVDWSAVGVPGGIPTNRTQCGSTIQASTYGNGSTDAKAAIQSALNACGANQFVLLSPGTFKVVGTLRVPSNVTLRGAGANQTILNASGATDSVVSLGDQAFFVSSTLLSISGGSTAGSRSITLANTSGVTVGGYLLVTETNDPTFVTNTGEEGACTWCDEAWNGNRARGQIVEVTGISGSTVTFTPGLYSAYTRSPAATPFTASAKYAGVESLQVYANKTGYTTNFRMSACAYCWIKGVEGNYADGDHVQVYFGFRDEVRDSYFSNAYSHGPGQTDADLILAYKTSATLVENNIFERLHESIMLNWGAAGNVIAYNFSTGQFDNQTAGATVLMDDLVDHGAHPQFNLWEGNTVGTIHPDATWGSSSHGTAFRNWAKGITFVCYPFTNTRANVNCADSRSYWTKQALFTINIDALSRYYSFVGNVVGSQEQATNGGASLTRQIVWPTYRSYDSVAYGYTFGYGGRGDDGSGWAGDNASPYTTSLIHGDFSHATGTITWKSGLTQVLPASFYRNSKPGWFGSTPWPAIGPDVTGGSGPGGHAHPIPALACYNGATVDATGLRVFNAESCYGTSTNPGTPAAPTNLTVVVT